jgi:hypothetical protein
MTALVIEGILGGFMLALILYFTGFALSAIDTFSRWK